MKSWTVFWKACILIFLAVTTSAIIIVARPTPPATRIPVINYHSIMSHEFYYPINVDNPWILSEKAFFDHMYFLYKNDFTTLTSDQLIDFLYYGAELPTRPVILTFDDGYFDNYLFAAPILRQFGFTGMNFLITSAIPEDTPQMVVYPSQFMSNTEIFASMDVFEFGSHTHNMHRRANGDPLLTIESVEDIRADIRQSFDAPLTFATGFAYPFGAYSDNAIRALQEEGVRFAFIGGLDYIYRDTNPFLLPRFCATSEWTMEHFIRIVMGQ
ncbi:MAG: polysaccharide deacetylase family protein [Defluviitaleaceae bacterium]|nr:polysaccharide deacetylase family protein [Defluviitaleaceae bacterium]